MLPEELIPPQRAGGAGSRAVRFMESTDFNAANRWVFNVVSRALRTSGRLSPVFFALELDSLTPGLIVASEIIRPNDDRLGPGALLEAGSDTADLQGADLATVAAAGRRLLAAETPRVSLVAHARQALTWAGGASAKRYPVNCVAVRLVSVDRCVGSIFKQRTDGSDRPHLSYSPPIYL